TRCRCRNGNRECGRETAASGRTARVPAKASLMRSVAVPARLSVSHVVEGTLLHRVDPTYPMDALRQRIQGQVVLQVRISKDGSVYGCEDNWWRAHPVSGSCGSGARVAVQPVQDE